SWAVSTRLLRRALVQTVGRGRLGLRCSGLRLPGAWIGRRSRVHAKIPHVKIHSLLPQHLHNGVLTRLQFSLGSDLHPMAAGNGLGMRRDEVLLLADFPINRDFDVPDN